MPLAICEAEGAAVTEGLYKVEFIDESRNLRLRPANSTLWPFEGDAASTFTNRPGHRNEVSEESH